MSKNLFLVPIVKWVGGKRQLLSEIMPLIPEKSKITTYVEPFFGGGAVFFELQPKKAIINDANSELMNMYAIIRDNPDHLIEKLKEYRLKNSEVFFYEIRNMDRNKEEFAKLTSIEKAARIIYLNRTCYNGLYRVNNAGEFNTPWGKYKNPNIVNEATIRAMSRYFQDTKTEIRIGDYKEALIGLRKGAFVYFDPPYMPLSSSANFTGYTVEGFGEREQYELKNECDKLDAKGVKFLLSNSEHPLIRELYKKYSIINVEANRTINSIAEKRGTVSEILVTNT